MKLNTFFFFTTKRCRASIAKEEETIFDKTVNIGIEGVSTRQGEGSKQCIGDENYS